MKDNDYIFYLIKDCTIIYDTKQEMLDIATILNNLGFKLYTKLENLKDLDYNGYYYDNNSFVRTRKIEGKELSYKDFMLLVSKKYKKIENPDIDPYNEEDWGYEIINNEIQEKIHLIKFKDYKIKRKL